MDDIVKFPCPSCGGTTYATGAKPQSYTDLIGMSCASCGHVATDEDIKGFARALAIKLAKKAFKNSGL